MASDTKHCIIYICDTRFTFVGSTFVTTSAWIAVKIHMTFSLINTKSHWGIPQCSLIHSFHDAGNCTINNKTSGQIVRVKTT